MVSGFIAAGLGEDAAGGLEGEAVLIANDEGVEGERGVERRRRDGAIGGALRRALRLETGEQAGRGTSGRTTSKATSIG